MALACGRCRAGEAAEDGGGVGGGKSSTSSELCCRRRSVSWRRRSPLDLRLRRAGASGSAIRSRGSSGLARTDLEAAADLGSLPDMAARLLHPPPLSQKNNPGSLFNLCVWRPSVCGGRGGCCCATCTAFVRRPSDRPTDTATTRAAPIKLEQAENRSTTTKWTHAAAADAAAAASGVCEAEIL